MSTKPQVTEDQLSEYGTTGWCSGGGQPGTLRLEAARDVTHGKPSNQSYNKRMETQPEVLSLECWSRTILGGTWEKTNKHGTSGLGSTLDKIRKIKGWNVKKRVVPETCGQLKVNFGKI